MAKHEVEDNKIGSYGNALVASTVDEVVFADTLTAVEVSSDEAGARIYFTTDGSVPTVGGAGTHEVPAIPSARTVLVASTNPRQPTTVKLKASEAREYSVAKAVVG
jgi:Chitobiase/beta-hexosaminidase C-terminal domain